ncbi:MULTISPECIES: hypothetical protein [Ignavibacterium]|jgi:hypothetical protein|uniref:hypothetical protein n=1 Tax=Ignavibacterium TaxID=795750 RepID=UPI0025C0A39C|nr:MULTISPECIES: hypothetical protein [Ignavibacterium]MBI5663451.1 hypothetical protein [Ignavibacterium album]
MKIYLPQNIFSRILKSELSEDSDAVYQYLPSALISKRLMSEDEAIGLIPSMDLITHKDFFVSAEIGISFNALLSNSYLHFKENQTTIDKLFLKGDISSNEALLSKILLKEMYDIDITPRLVTPDFMLQDENMLIAGDENYEKELFLNGLSFAEEIIELINAPYVNFLFASKNENSLKSFVIKHRDDFISGHSGSFENLLSGYPEQSVEFISVNMQHVIFDLEDQDLEGIKALLQLPYYHGITNDLFEIKFV